eukprot:Skav206387  [mRNA]  locus=scaffold834:538407:547754:- [translate_table: standard]
MRSERSDRVTAHRSPVTSRLWPAMKAAQGSWTPVQYLWKSRVPLIAVPVLIGLQNWHSEHLSNDSVAHPVQHITSEVLLLLGLALGTGHRGVNWLMDELCQSTARLARAEVCGGVAVHINFLERGMRPGEELAHLRQMLARVSYRGTELRSYVSLGDDAEDQHEVPYPALRWEWRTILSFPWDRESHINELELCAVIAAAKNRCRTAKKFHQRWFLIVDSMVTRGALAKGRSPSRRLNRLLRKSAALALAQNSYVIPLWTISRWNFSDEASRRFEKAT